MMILNADLTLKLGNYTSYIHTEPTQGSKADHKSLSSEFIFLLEKLQLWAMLRHSEWIKSDNTSIR